MHVSGGGAVLGAVAGVGRDVVAVLLICVVVARARGGMTVLRPILFVQARPAILAITAMALG